MPSYLKYWGVRMKSNKTQQFWNKQAKKYDYSERQFESAFIEIISKTKNYLNIDDTVLDYGCATGSKTVALAESVNQIHGLDFSNEMINVAIKRKNKANINNVHFLQGTIYENIFENETFDKIVAYGIIHLLEDKEHAIQKIHGLLKPGGLFISSTACLKDKMAFKNRLDFSVYLLIKKIGIFPLHLNMLTTSDTEKIICGNKFQIIEAEKLFCGITISFVIARKI